MREKEMMEKSTELLQAELKNAEKPEDFFAANETALKEKSVAQYLNEMLLKYRMDVGDVARRAELGNYAYQIFDGKKNAGREKLIQLAFGFPLTLEETQRLLRCGSHSELYVKSKREAYLMYALGKAYSLQEANELLFKNDEKTFE